jgi:hypothetical protein
VGRSVLSASTAAPAVVSVHAANSESQPRRLVHMGVVVGDAPASTIHWRRLSRSCFRAARTCCRAARFRSRNSASSGPVTGRALPWYLSMETSPFGDGCKPTESRANSTRKLQIRSPRLPPGASWSEGGGVRAGYSDVLRRLVKRAFLQGHSRRSVTRRWCGLARRRPPSWSGMAAKSRRPTCFRACQIDL